MENRITGLPELHRRVDGDLKEAQATADDGRRALARPFKHADDLTQAPARVEQITTDIQPAEQPPPPRPVHRHRPSHPRPASPIGSTTSATG